MARTATLVSRFAALLRGGMAAPRAIELLAAESERAGGAPEAVRIAERVAAGSEIAWALAAEDRPEWRVVAATWSLAESSGAPLATALDRITAALRELDGLRSRREVLLSGPRATTRMIALLPPLALVIGVLLGFDPLPVLLRPAGAVMLLLGFALLGAGVIWARWLRVALEREDRVAGLELDLMWVALGGGSAPSAALVRVADSVDRFRAEWVGFDGLCEGEPLRATIVAAAGAGVPLGPMLLEAAELERRRAQAQLEQEAERLGVRVLLPLGLCVLPSFVVLGVLPVILSMLGAV